MKYVKTPEYLIGLVLKAGSSTLSRAIIRDFYPDIEAKIQSAVYPVGKGPDNSQWQGLVPSTKELDGTPVLIPVRDPVERFRSACAQFGLIDAEPVITALETSGTVSTPFGRAILPATNQHFSIVADGLPTECKLYRFPDQLDNLSETAGLTLPLPVINEASTEKPVLTVEQEARVLAYYAADKLLFDNIIEPGQLFTALPTPLTDADRNIKLAELTDARYAAETGGITLNGITVRTDRESQAMLNGAYTTCQMNPDAIIDWKGVNGWVQLDASAITAIAQAVSAHVQSCFTRERLLAEQVTVAETAAELEAIVY
jgi:hypothetical protein